jgi:Tol biopolymer transport system component
MRTAFATALLLLLPILALANGYENYPSPLAWSPDSSFLASAEAYQWPYNDGLVSGVLRLYDSDGTALGELLAGDSIGSPAFSPDNTMLICVHDGKIAQFPTPFTRTPVSFIAAPAAVLDCAFESTYSDDSQFLLATCGERFYGANIWRVRRDGSELTQLTFAGQDTSAVMPLSFAKGSMLFLRQPGDDSGAAYERIWSWNTGAKETEAIQLTAPQSAKDWPEDYHESNPVVISTNPLQVMFQRGGWGDWKLMLWNEDGSEQLELPDAEEPSVSADGRWLAFVRRPAYAKAQTEYDWDVVPQIWLADRQCRQLWHVDSSIAGGEFATVSPDGAHLAWIEYNEGNVRTVIREVAEITAGEPSETY